MPDQDPQRLLESITHIQNHFLEDDDATKSNYFLLDELLALTDSDFGFFGEVLLTHAGEPYMSTYAINDVSWDADNKKMYEQMRRGHLLFRNPDEMFGNALSSAIPVIINNDETDSSSDDQPLEQLPLKSFLALPVHNKDDMVGMICLAKRSGKYQYSIYKYLEPVIQFIALLIGKNRLSIKRGEDNRDHAVLGGGYDEWLDKMPGVIYRFAVNDGLRLIKVGAGIEDATGYSVNTFLSDEPLLYSSLINGSDIDEVLSVMNSAVASKTAYDIEYRITDFHGKTRWIHDEGCGVYDGNKKLLYLAGNLKDISYQKISENEQVAIRDRMLQAQQMQTVGQMAGGIAHDFNNVLATVMGYTELCMELIEEKEYDKLGVYLKYVHDAGIKASDIVSSMIAFSRGSDADPLPLNISSLFEETGKVLDVALPKTISVQYESDVDLPAVLFDASSLQQTIVSLCMNASDAMENHGEITIKATDVELDHCTCVSCHDEFSGQFIKLEISDRGPGIDQKILARIFDPFFTTKHMGNGAGMGLSVVHGILHKFNGHITVVSHPEKGSVFSLYLAIASQAGVSNSEKMSA